MIMEEKDTELRDEGLRGNEKIEEAIAGLQQEPTQEMLAHALTVVRRRMKENGQLIVAVEPPAGGGQLLLQTVKTSDGKLWWAAFTGFEEELRGSDRVKSTFFGGYGTAVCNRAAGRRRGRDHFESLEPDADAGKRADPDYFGAAGVKHLREAADMGRKCWTGGCRSRN